MRFVDTSFWVALRYARDRRHSDAREVWEQNSGALLTTTLVVGESWTFFGRRSGHTHARSFLDSVIRSPSLTIRHLEEDLEQEAFRWLRRRDEREYSFVDATSFALMRRLRIREALAFDGDFAAAGFVEVRPASSS